MPVCTEELYTDLFAEAEAALALEHCDTHEWGDEQIRSDDEDEFGNNVLETRLHDARSRCVTLPGGDVHVCDGDCPFAEEDGGGNFVCPHTGHQVARVCCERSDYSTGHSIWSSDPDMVGGKPFGGWCKKRDMVKASRSAWQDSGDLDDSEMPCARPIVLAPGAHSAPTKRGALCVGEETILVTAPKRQRATKRDVGVGDMRQGLLAEAERTMLDLLGKQCGSNLPPKAPTVDARLLNKDVLFPAVLKKYLKSALASGLRPQMDDVHNISLSVDKVIAEELARNKCPSIRVRQPGFREASARLAVSLWTCACRTPYILEMRRGADAFRPFCAGVFYAFKRGLTLPDGTVLVPRIDAFTNALPTQRTISADATSKSLHASSHKGLRALHRCINSVDAPVALTLFDEAVRVAKSMR